MTDIAIRVEQLSKLYRVGQTQGHDFLVHSLLTLPRKLVQGMPIVGARHSSGDGHHPSRDTIWALKDVSFDVKRGEVLGVIGRNGSGKSTLLKILSRITEPTEGRVEVQGRVGSLLEVGTGFHPDLTGRENVYLNGAILGMKKTEIDRKFDEVVDFAGIARFIDTPVKRYSSGMYMRLAFSVAAYLQPEVLLVDEVLAVGDHAFQKKSLGRMDSIAKEGRTVIFVSHNMQAIIGLCHRVLQLGDGRVVDQGEAGEVVERYLSGGTNQAAKAIWPFQGAPGDNIVRLCSIQVFAQAGRVSYQVPISEPINMEMTFWCFRKTTLLPSLHLFNQQRVLVFVATNASEPNASTTEYGPGLHRCTYVIPPYLLNEGMYSASAFLSKVGDGEPHVQVQDAVSFHVVDDGSERGAYAGKWLGAVRVRLPWSTERIGDLPQNATTTVG